MKAIILPGNGSPPVTYGWYPYVKKKLEGLGFEVTSEEMPDPDLARRKYWIPFIKEKLEGDEKSVLIGHSSGATAILKFLEENKCKVAILVGTYYTDLDNENERLSGYFDDDWKWDLIKENAERIIIFASTDDPYIAIDEPRFMKERLSAEYHEFNDRGHFDGKEFPELVEAVKKSSGF